MEDKFKKIKKSASLIFFSALFFGYLINYANGYEGSVYYVDAIEGNDAWSGRLSVPNIGKTDGPWKTIGRVNSFTFQPGDDIYFKRGQAWKSRLIAKLSGTATNYATIGAYGAGDKPIIDGDHKLPGPAPCTRDICWNGMVDVTGRNYVIVENLRVINIEGVGIKVGTGSTNIKVLDCETSDTYREGILIGATIDSYTTVERCKVELADMVWPESGKISGWPAGLVAVRSTHVTIRNNIVRNIYGEGIGIFSNSSNTAAQSKNCIVEGNTVIGARAAGIYIGGSAYNTVRNNIVLGTNDSRFHRSEGFVGTGILLANEIQTGENNNEHNEVYNNLIAYTGACFEVGGNDDAGNVGDLKFYNNTCISNRYNIDSWSAGPLANHYDLDIRNNIFTCVPGDTCEQVGQFKKAWISFIDYNYHTSAPNSVYLGAHSIVNADIPVIKNSGWQNFTSFIYPSANDFKQKLSALTINKAISLDPVYNRDFFGILRPQGVAWDIGAHEYAGSTPTYIPGDLNKDSKVDIADYSMFIQDFGKTGTNLPADLNKNGQVEIGDYSIFISNFGKTS